MLCIGLVWFNGVYFVYCLSIGYLFMIVICLYVFGLVRGVFCLGCIVGLFVVCVNSFWLGVYCLVVWLDWACCFMAVDYPGTCCYRFAFGTWFTFPVDVWFS